MKIFPVKTLRCLFVLPMLFSIFLCSAQAKHGSDSAFKCPCQYPSLAFKGDSIKLTATHKIVLEDIAKSLKRNPEGILIVTMHSGPSKHGQGICQRRIDMIKKYMIEKVGISGDRVVSLCDTDSGATNTADMECSVKGD